MNWITNNIPLILERTGEHLAIAIPAIVLSFLVSIPIGWIATHYSWGRGTVLTLVGLLYALPSLPLFFVLPLILGTGLRDPINVTVGLTLYGIALMVRSAADGFSSVDSHVEQSASAVGFSAVQRFWRVELPLAGPVLLAGVRVVSVSTVSLATVGAVLGIGSLGSLFTDGFQRNITAEILTGIVMTVLLALLLDLLLVVIGRVLMPWARTSTPRRVARARQAEAVTA